MILHSGRGGGGGSDMGSMGVPTGCGACGVPHTHVDNCGGGPDQFSLQPFHITGRGCTPCLVLTRSRF